MIVFVSAIAVILLFLGFMVIKNALLNRRRKHLAVMPFSYEWEKIIEKNVSLYKHLPDSLKEQLHNDIRIFIDEKHFEGVGGLEITDEIKVTVAAEACMLLLNRKNKDYPGLSSIVVYPNAYVAREKTIVDGGVHVEGQSVRLGESWHHGSVVLAWDNVKQGAINPQDGHNVVLHEFAHQLDQEDGVSDGTPILEKRSSYAAWAHILSEEFEHLRSNVEHHKKSVMDEYGSTNPAEFFAVATETFFEKPVQLKKKAPDLYNELKIFYKVDPVEWLK